jgi:hypothetical protein
MKILDWLRAKEFNLQREMLKILILIILLISVLSINAVAITLIEGGAISNITNLNVTNNYNTYNVSNETILDVVNNNILHNVVYEGDENKTLVYCGNITGATSDLCTLAPGAEIDPVYTADKPNIVFNNSGIWNINTTERKGNSSEDINALIYAALTTYLNKSDAYVLLSTYTNLSTTYELLSTYINSSAAYSLLSTYANQTWVTANYVDIGSANKTKLTWGNITDKPTKFGNSTEEINAIIYPLLASYANTSLLSTYLNTSTAYTLLSTYLNKSTAYTLLSTYSNLTTVYSLLSTYWNISSGYTTLSTYLNTSTAYTLLSTYINKSTVYSLLSTYANSSTVNDSIQNNIKAGYGIDLTNVGDFINITADINTVNLKFTSGEINTIQDITTTSNVTFNKVSTEDIVIDQSIRATNWQSRSIDYNMTCTNFFVIGTRAAVTQTILLPLASCSSGTIGGYIVVIKRNTATASVNVTARTGDNIDGLSYYLLDVNKEAVTLLADGDHTWYVIAAYSISSPS